MLRVPPDLSEAGSYYSHFRDGKPKTWEKTWCSVVWCLLGISASCRWSLLFSALLKAQTVTGLSISAVAIRVKARIRTLRILTASEHCYRALPMKHMLNFKHECSINDAIAMLQARHMPNCFARWGIALKYIKLQHILKIQKCGHFSLHFEHCQGYLNCVCSLSTKWSTF